MQLTLWEHSNPNAPRLKNWEMMDRQDPTIMPGLCLQAQGSDTIGKVAYSIDGSDFMHGGLRRYSSFLYEGEKTVFFDYFKAEPQMKQDIAPDQKLEFRHVVPWCAPEPRVGRYDVLPLDRQELMESKVQEAYRSYVLSELVNPALQQALDLQDLVMISSGGEISLPIIVQKGNEKAESSDNTLAVLTHFRDRTGKTVRRLEICQKRAEDQLRQIYTSLDIRFGYQVEMRSL